LKPAGSLASATALALLWGQLLEASCPSTACSCRPGWPLACLCFPSSSSCWCCQVRAALCWMPVCTWPAPLVPTCCSGQELRACQRVLISQGTCSQLARLVGGDCTVVPLQHNARRLILCPGHLCTGAAQASHQARRAACSVRQQQLAAVRATGAFACASDGSALHCRDLVILKCLALLPSATMQSNVTLASAVTN
jgi:hypothetical protein